MDFSDRLRIPCDKNRAWEKINMVVDLWLDGINTIQVQEKQVNTFRDMLTGMLMVEHDKGEPIKLFKSLYNGEGKIEYGIFRRWMDYAGVPESSITCSIKRVTLYPSGDFKIEYEGKRKTEWK